MVDQLSSLLPVVFFVTIIVLAIVETLSPKRSGTISLGRRWLANVSLFLTNTTLLQLLAPLSGLALATWATSENIGLFHAVAVPQGVALVFGVFVMDLGKYGEHVLLHRVPVLWRLHTVHHADVNVDFTTAERHHPLEALFGAAGLGLVVIAFGVPPLAVMLYVLFAKVVALLSHVNLEVPEPVDRAVRVVLVTPGMHAVHHSALRHETDSNYGVLLSWWDRLFGSYTTPSIDADRRRVYGLEYFRDPRYCRFDRILALPFLSARGRQAGDVPDIGAGREPVVP